MFLLPCYHPVTSQSVSLDPFLGDLVGQSLFSILKTDVDYFATLYFTMRGWLERSEFPCCYGLTPPKTPACYMFGTQMNLLLFKRETLADSGQTTPCALYHPIKEQYITAVPRTRVHFLFFLCLTTCLDWVTLSLRFELVFGHSQSKTAIMEENKQFSRRYFLMFCINTPYFSHIMSCLKTSITPPLVSMCSTLTCNNVKFNCTFVAHHCHSCSTCYCLCPSPHCLKQQNQF